jgi:phosphate transport system protein
MLVLEHHTVIEVSCLKSQVLTMGGLVEKNFQNAMSVLRERRPELMSELWEIEKRINDMHSSVDESSFQFIAMQGPKAKDLRSALAFIKMSTDLERMGDQAINIAQTSQDLIRHGLFELPKDLEIMVTEVQQMINLSLTALAKGNPHLAIKVLKRDDQVDRLKREIFDFQLARLKEMVSGETKEPVPVELPIDFILISRNLEKLGDHATNLAEDILFILTGKDVRHSREQVK